MFDFLNQWRRERQARVLRKRFCGSHTPAALKRLVDLAAIDGVPLHLSDHALVGALESTLPWPLDRVDVLFIIGAFADVVHQGNASDAQWTVWIRAMQTAGLDLDVSKPATARALGKAEKAGVLKDLPPDARDILLKAYERACCNLLDQTPPESREAAELLIELASLAELTQTSEITRLLDKWRASFPVRPRGLTKLETKQTLRAPIRGVGSPNGVSVTMYHHGDQGQLVRITSAGATPDERLNAQLLEMLFAASLACEAEPAFLSTIGCTLSFVMGDETQKDVGRSVVLLSGAIGPAGPIEPKGGVATLGMTPKESLLLTADTFSQMQNQTGLIKVMRWDFEDAADLENRIRGVLEQPNGDDFWFRSEPTGSEGATVIHALPLLERTDNGEVRPISVALDFAALGRSNVFRLLRMTRVVYMQQLIADGHRRRKMAEEEASEQARAIAAWMAMSEADRTALCSRAPTVTITRQIDFELGRSFPLKKPREVPRQEYEGAIRPRIQSDAVAYSKKFAEIVKKLVRLNVEGGRVDLMSFKLLMDSMLRGAELPIGSAEFQECYRTWVANSSLATWLALTTWATERGYPLSSLAADNVVFNARLDAKLSQVLIEPWILVDLHDFLVHVDRKRGTMRVFPNGRTPSLESSMVPSADSQITDALGLHKRFCEYVGDKLHEDTFFKQTEAFGTARAGFSKRITAYIAVARARRLMSAGRVKEARAVLDAARSTDQPAVYFWGAVAHATAPFVTALVDASDAVLQPESGKPIQAALAVVARGLADKQFNRGLSTAVQKYLAQLRGKDSGYVERLIAPGADAHAVEFDSFRFSEEEKRQLPAVIAAVSSFELLALSESVSARASEFQFSGAATSEVRRSIAKLLLEYQGLSFRSTPEAAQVTDLNRLLAGESE